MSSNRKPTLAPLFVFALGTLLPSGGHAVQIEFDQPSYSAITGAEVTVEVRIDHEGRIPESLFSYGIRLVPDDTTGLTLTAITVPAELDYNGFSSGARIDADPAILGAKGNINLGSGNYAGTLIATYVFSYDSPGTYNLGLEIYRTLGENEDVFIDGDGVTIDDLIEPIAATATLTVIDPIPDLESINFRIFEVIGNTVTLSFNPQAGFDHTAEFKNNLLDPTWTPVPGGPHNTGTVIDTLPVSGIRFYRLVVVPAP